VAAVAVGRGASGTGMTRVSLGRLAAAASVARCSPGDARRALEDLTEAHLLTAPSPGGYAMHGLLKSYAAEQAADLADSGCGTG